jgi:hypothetical protein
MPDEKPKASLFRAGKDRVTTLGALEAENERF